MKLQEFYLDEAMREEVKGFIKDFLAKKVVEDVFANKDITGIYQAKLLIDGAFSDLEVKFKPKKGSEPDNSR